MFLRHAWSLSFQSRVLSWILLPSCEILILPLSYLRSCSSLGWWQDQLEDGNCRTRKNPGLAAVPMAEHRASCHLSERRPWTSKDAWSTVNFVWKKVRIVHCSRWQRFSKYSFKGSLVTQHFMKISAGFLSSRLATPYTICKPISHRVPLSYVCSPLYYLSNAFRWDILLQISSPYPETSR